MRRPCVSSPRVSKALVNAEGHTAEAALADARATDTKERGVQSSSFSLRATRHSQPKACPLDAPFHDAIILAEASVLAAHLVLLEVSAVPAIQSWHCRDGTSSN